jgi:SAM-dependent methyltransferase
MSEGFSDGQAHDLAGIDPRHFWFAGRNRLIVWALRRYFPTARSVLEVGCGTGHVLRAIAEAQPELALTGSEMSAECVKLAAGAVPSATMVQADTRDLPYDREFDVVGAFDVLEHIHDDGAALAAMVRAVRPGGGIMLTVPQHMWLWSPLDDYSRHYRRYTRQGLVGLARRTGLDILRATSFVTLLLPGLLVSRVMQRRVEMAPGREFTISARVNGLGTAAMRAELALVRRGLSLPVGGSLLVVARRPLA